MTGVQTCALPIYRSELLLDMVSMYVMNDMTSGLTQASSSSVMDDITSGLSQASRSSVMDDMTSELSTPSV